MSRELAPVSGWWSEPGSEREPVWGTLDYTSEAELRLKVSGELKPDSRPTYRR